MNTNKNTQADLRTRLIAFLIVLAVGFVMGVVNGRGSSTTQDGASTGIVATPQTEDDGKQSSAEATATNQTQEPSEKLTLKTDESVEAAPAPQQTNTTDDGSSNVAPTRGPTVEEDGQYISKDEVALYIHTYGRLPSNFISKTKARNRGWVAEEGNLDEVCPGMSIGGSRYYNDDGKLPDKRGRQWTECDINYTGGYRGAERIVFSNDGLIFYTDDHYETFVRLY